MNPDIQVKLQNGTWASARNYQTTAFNQFKHSVPDSPNIIHEAPYEYINGIGANQIKFNVSRLGGNHGGIYMIRENNTNVPLADWNNVKVFLLDHPSGNAEWYGSHNYQTWAYFDFIYSGDFERKYKSKGTIANDDYIEIPIDWLPSDIVFRISKNANGTIFYERDDVGRTRVRISDNDESRQEYMEFYNHQDNQGHQGHQQPQGLEIYRDHDADGYLHIPHDIEIVQTLDDDLMCVVCNENKQNICFHACKHTQTCSQCYLQLARQMNWTANKHEIKCPMCRANIEGISKYIPEESTNASQIIGHEEVNWFEKAFGFGESPNYATNRDGFNQMYINENQQSLNGIRVGTFHIVPNSYYNSWISESMPGGKVIFENIAGNIKDIHANSALSSRATIQVASQLNCLEMATPNHTPEMGITIYQYDKTQGPVCAVSAPAGLVYRNYLHYGGQTLYNQIDMATELLQYLKTLDPTITWIMQNGYLMFNNEEQLRKINRALASNQNHRKEARKTIQSGSHTNQGVFVSEATNNHLVNHVYCSGLPISYNNLPPNLWDGLAELFLEAMYENTLFQACINNIESGENKPCYLTKIGGGVFGMKDSQIIRAIQRACNIIARKGLQLNVKIVHYGNIQQEYAVLPTQYPINGHGTESVWDDGVWLASSL